MSERDFDIVPSSALHWRSLSTKAAFSLPFALICTTPALADAETGEAPVTPANWSHAWSWEMGIVLPLVLIAVLYCLGHRRVLRRNRRNPAIRPWQALCFWLGWLSLVVALVSPLHELGEALFSAHMAQHEILMVVAAPLLALSRPMVAFLFALPFSWRRRIGRWTRSSTVRKTWRFLTGALVAWVIQAVTLWAWHIPAFYQATLKNDDIHALQHTMFLVSALLFWYTLFYGRHGRLGYGMAFIYIFTTALQTSVLGAVMTLAQTAWYPIYNGRTAPWGLSLLQDQQLGGLIMWIPSGIVLVIAGLALFAGWISEAERRQSLSPLWQSRNSSLDPPAQATPGALHAD
jgi:putative membrane protein